MELFKEETKGKRAKQSRRQRLLAKIEELMGESFDDIEIEDKLNLSPERLQKYKQVIFDRYRMSIHTLTPEKIFSDYSIKMKGIVKELDEAITLCREGNQLQAMVSGIWRKKEISDSVIKLGQELGFLPKNAKELRLTNDFSFTSMTSEEIRMEIDREKKKFAELVTRKIHIRPEVAEFMDPATRAKLPKNAVIIDSSGKPSKTKGKARIR